MKLKIISFAIVVIAAVINFISCSRTNDVTPSHVTLNANSTTLDNTSNLGRVLFYDTHLSVNNSIACASCHKQQYAFSDNVALSPGYENKLGTRNAFTLQNLFSSSVLFWDGRDSSLAPMTLMPMLNHVEMGMNDVTDVVTRITNVPYYADLFTKAYGSSEITAEGIANALSYFIQQIQTFNTRFDSYQNGTGTLTPTETQGMNLFFGKYNCGSCHQVNQSSYNVLTSFANIGLDVVYTDNGLGAVTNRASDDGKFKIPNLRNVALTSPYMHDGRYATLNDVLEHYSSGIADNPNLDSRLRDAAGNPLKMNIPDADRTALIAFLNALTDYTVVASTNLATPFK